MDGRFREMRRRPRVGAVEATRGATERAASAWVRFVRNSVVGAPDLAAARPNGRYRGCDAAPFSDRSGQSVCCWSEGRDFNPAGLGSKPPSAVDRTQLPLRLMSVPLPLHARSTSSRKTPSGQVNRWLPEIHNSLNIKQYIGWTRVTPIAGHAPRIPGSAVCGPVAHAAAQTLAPSSSAFPNTWTSPGISGANALTACRIHSMSETIAIRSKSLRCISPTRASLQTAPGV